jgi:hypothetical protein
VWDEVVIPSRPAADVTGDAVAVYRLPLDARVEKLPASVVEN